MRPYMCLFMTERSNSVDVCDDSVSFKILVKIPIRNIWFGSGTCLLTN